MQRFHHMSAQTLLMLIRDRQHEAGQDYTTTKDDNPDLPEEAMKY